MNYIPKLTFLDYLISLSKKKIRHHTLHIYIFLSFITNTFHSKKIYIKKLILANLSLNSSRLVNICIFIYIAVSKKKVNKY